MLFTSDTKLENKFSKGESMRYESLHGRLKSSSCEKFRETVNPPQPQTCCFNKKKTSHL